MQKEPHLLEEILAHSDIPSHGQSQSEEVRFRMSLLTESDSPYIVQAMLPSF